MTTKQILPAIIIGEPALKDVNTTLEAIKGSNLGRTATVEDTPIFICQLDACNRLFPSRDRLLMHRKRDHNSEDAFTSVLTWNTDTAQDQNQESTRQ